MNKAWVWARARLESLVEAYDRMSDDDKWTVKMLLGLGGFVLLVAIVF